MKQFKLILVVVALIALSASAFAAPSFRGYTGLVVVPTADSLDKGDWNFGLMTEDTGEFDVNDIFVNYSPAENLEVGFNSQSQVNANARETLFNAKYSVVRETAKTPAVAFGAIDMTKERESTVYVVASKSLGTSFAVSDKEVTSIRGHVGIGGGQFDGVFAGLSGWVGNFASLSAEWDSRDFNFGLNIYPTPRIAIHGGWFDPAGNNNFGFGASYTVTY